MRRRPDVSFVEASTVAEAKARRGVLSGSQPVTPPTLGVMADLLELDGDWVEPLLAPSRTERLGVARLRGAARGRTAGALAWVLVEGGSGTLRAGSHAVEIDGRHDVFSDAGWSVLVPPGEELAIEGDLRSTVVWCASNREGEVRLIKPNDAVAEDRGEGTTARHVRTYVAEGPLIVGETLNPPGGWSSWPPHRHEHEEIYLYRFAPEHGFGVHVGLDDDNDRPVVVRDGSIQRIAHGWHPVVAAPGCTMYYLWALAGDTDTVDTRLDVRFS